VKRALLVATACAFALVGCGEDSSDEGAPSEPPAWNHDPDDAVLGPNAWGDIDRSFESCRTGLAQSPVDVSTTVPGDLPELDFDYPATPLVVENTGHTIEVPMPEDGTHTLEVGDDEYRLVQFHFHAPSEHSVDGRSFDAEAHLVHESADGELAVVGVLLQEGDPALPLADLVIESAPAEAGQEVELEEERSPLELFLALDATTGIVTEYSTYVGSLTTPPCSEGVRWLVLPDPAPVSASAVDRLHHHVSDFPEYGGYESNNRPTQRLNDREILRKAG
jgi:carbonic anhydrase